MIIKIIICSLHMYISKNINQLTEIAPFSLFHKPAFPFENRYAVAHQ